MGEKRGRLVEPMDLDLSEICGTKHAVACTSGTTALHLAFATLGIGPGDEVIVPTFTMIATANAVRYAGGTPVFVDSEPETGNLDPGQVERAITPRTKAVVPIHTYGHPADMERLLAICAKHGLYLVEDAAEAHGAEWKGRRAGSIGEVGCFSFYANKIITTGEGGMLVTDNPDLARISRNLRDHAFSEERHFWHKFTGYNYRMTNLQAAVGVAQMERIDSFVETRRRNASRYTAGLAGLPGLSTPVEKPGFKNVFWMYGIRLDETAFGLDRDGLRRELAERGIETRTFFIPMHLQPIFFKAAGGEYPVA
ncbi:MAG: DegT/DnrJ/EryC1/StrS family aminotransferase, partial [Nitrospirae bacterium]|nr:DegT/DnrJ/EryC1/StrS family aminotransferase [Nitrospirota bacterium]